MNREPITKLRLNDASNKRILILMRTLHEFSDRNLQSVFDKSSENLIWV